MVMLKVACVDLVYLLHLLKIILIRRICFSIQRGVLHKRLLSQILLGIIQD
jgi:hypothetical protein